jgi:hypothetical protein
MRTECSVPTCRLNATTTWATVPVCQSCKNIIRNEQFAYYKGKIAEHERRRYIRIRHMTPMWPVLKRELALTKGD